MRTALEEKGLLNKHAENCTTHEQVDTRKVKGSYVSSRFVRQQMIQQDDNFTGSFVWIRSHSFFLIEDARSSKGTVFFELRLHFLFGHGEISR